MKLTKKKVFVVAVAICLIAIISMSTLAWFSAQDEVTNEFDVMDSLSSFDVDVWEEIPDGDDADSDPDIIGKGDTTENTGVYEDVVPGGQYDKKVYVENTSNNELAGQYIKMELTFTNYSGIHAMGTTVAPFDCTTMLLGPNFSTLKDANEAWWYDQSATIYNETANTVTYVFYLKEVLANTASTHLFEGVEIPTTMDINDADYLIKTGGFQIKAVAYAIQSANIADPNGTTTLDNVVYAFNTAWANRDTETATPTFPTVPTNP
jgi:predicted ribosomally synthesized peptide with SipW-like signal peptide